jgi:very-short-patch-repair endonuclease
MRFLQSTENIVAILRDRHGDRFDYSRIIWVNANTKISLSCKHGDFTVYPGNALRQDWVGCRWCGGESRQALYGQKILGRFAEVWGDEYDYSEFIYPGQLTKATIVCKKHGPFEMTPANHLTGHGCSSCKNNAPSAQENVWIAAIAKELGLTPSRSVKIPGFYGTLDAVFGNVAVEYDGAYWHSREGALDKDTRKTAAAKAAGYSVVRLRAYSKRWVLTNVPEACNVHITEHVTPDQLRVVREAIQKETQ